MAKESPQPLNPRGGTVLCHVRLPSLDAEKGSRTSASDVLTRSRLAVACGSGWSMLVAKKGRGVQQQPIVPVVFARDVGDNPTTPREPCLVPSFPRSETAMADQPRRHLLVSTHLNGNAMKRALPCFPAGGLGLRCPITLPFANSRCNGTRNTISRL